MFANPITHKTKIRCVQTAQLYRDSAKGKPAPRGKGTKKPKTLLAIQRGGEARAPVIPEESADDITAALTPDRGAGVVAGQR